MFDAGLHTRQVFETKFGPQLQGICSGYSIMRIKLIPVVLAVLLLGGTVNSCFHYTVNPCDTCGLNQDSLQRIKDSLAHAFTWKQFSVPGEVAITGSWVFGENDIYVLGSYLWHFDGSSFTKIHLVNKKTG